MVTSESISQAYSSPPITEAVISVVFDSNINKKTIDSANVKFQRYYSKSDSLSHVNVNLDMANHQSKIDQQDSGYRLSTEDMTQLLLLQESSFTVSQRAPYPGWDVFFDRFVRDWKVWKRVVKHKKIKRIGVRYINRLDIPAEEATVVDEEYLNFYPKIPEVFSPLIGYKLQCALPLESGTSQLQLNSAVVPSPLLGHISIILDQDIIRLVDVPQKDEDIFKLLSDIRHQKNEVFESCITEKARRLFGNGRS